MSQSDDDVQRRCAAFGVQRGTMRHDPEFLIVRSAARRRFCEFEMECVAAAVGVDLQYDGDDLESVEHAREVWRLLDEPLEYEVISASRDLAIDGKLLGFDVGWFSNYSIISDTVVMPTWHPPQPADFSALAYECRELNEHVLFSGPDSAGRFLRWYRTRPWGEDFGYENTLCIINVGRVDPRA